MFASKPRCHSAGQLDGPVRHWPSVLALAATAFLCLGAGSAFADSNPNGPFLGVVKTKSATRQVTSKRALGRETCPGTFFGGCLGYHGGPLMTSGATVYSIYWDPNGSFDPSYKDSVDQYINDVAIDSGSNSNVYFTSQEYLDSGSNPALYSHTFGGRLDDVNAYPDSGCTDPRGINAVCLTDQQLQDELNSVIDAYALPRDLNTIYAIFTPEGVSSCFSAASNSCSYTHFCAYHSYLDQANGGLYANQPYISGRPGCDPNQRPNNNAADAVINPLSHELMETITDPTGLGYWDSSTGAENGDKCNFIFGAPLGNTGTGNYNQVINGNPYWTQLEWSNRKWSDISTTTGCEAYQEYP
ncbi:MAG: hypothetical protein NVSMB51_12080 [Solirubrobacteraceae bacterium]